MRRCFVAVVMAAVRCSWLGGTATEEYSGWRETRDRRTYV